VKPDRNAEMRHCQIRRCEDHLFMTAAEDVDFVAAQDPKAVLLKKTGPPLSPGLARSRLQF